MRPNKHRTLIWSLLLMLPFFLACQAQTPEQIVNEARSQYNVQITGSLPQQPVSDASEADEALQEGEDTDSADADQPASPDSDEASIEDTVDEEGCALPEEQQPVPVLFDVIVSFDGRKPLPGVTVDIEHKDPFDKVKGTYRQFIETPNMAKDDVLLKDFVLEDVSYEPGDLFILEIRSPIPPEEQSEYREFALVAGS